MNNNYTYIVASIPVLSPSFKPEGGSTASVLEWIKSQLGGKDRQALDFVCSGFTPANLCEEFYRKAFAAKDVFTRSYFAADLALRNAKVEYLNKALDRPEGKDVMHIENAPESPDSKKIAAIFQVNNLLERERAIDDYLWAKTDEITLMMNFRLENILAIAAKLCIIERWLALDEEEGRKLLAKLVKDIRGNYGDINFETIK